MRRGLQRDISKRILDAAQERIQQGERREVIGSADGSGFSSVGNEPIHDPDGNLYFMSGVSKCGGPDMCGP